MAINEATVSCGHEDSSFCSAPDNGDSFCFQECCTKQKLQVQPKSKIQSYAVFLFDGHIMYCRVYKIALEIVVKINPNEYI